VRAICRCACVHGMRWAVTWLNIAVDLHATARDAAVDKALLSYRALIYLLRMGRDSAEEGDVDAFIGAMTQVAVSLKDAIVHLGRGRYPGARIPAPPQAGTAGVLPSLHVLYDQACLQARLGQHKSALRKLERAAGLEGNREDALTDPWFARLRTVEGAQLEDGKRFWEIVGPPPRVFTQLPAFGEKGADLKAIGVTGAAELHAATGSAADCASMGDNLKVPIAVVTGWQRLAELAHPPNPLTVRSRWLTARELDVLLAAGIRSRDDLPTQASGQARAVRDKLRGAATDLGVRPLDHSEFNEVASRFR
jgi:hypothetical protein